jgi:hypothetical protein
MNLLKQLWHPSDERYCRLCVDCLNAQTGQHDFVMCKNADGYLYIRYADQPLCSEYLRFRTELDNGEVARRVREGFAL